MGLHVPSWATVNGVALAMTSFTNRLHVSEITTKPWSFEQDVAGALIAYDLLNA
jgi:hypothetical protein